ncbi:MAG: chromosome segregation protein SMC [Acidimicrobiia bacterium]
MFLKSLTLKGFKSFADATTLEMEPGVTVVVGPNGSGKSNVVDAIGWVLGAQAPSTMRSQKMDDVIFAGTTGRGPLGRAEVGLTIDNSSGLLPIEFSEVTLTRTLFRSGDSEYAINGVACRLLDITELLSDTGVGRQQHVIVSQGQIDAVLNARPEDRRLIIEEAAGVLKFRKRKEKAERRLSATEGNLIRAQDLLREVRRQLRPLGRQAEAARRHGDVAAELAQLRLFLAGREIAALQARRAAAIGERGDLATAEAANKASLVSLDQSVTATESRLSALGGHDVSDALVRFDSLREKARGLAAVLAERGRNLERRRSALIDEALVASLEAESATLVTELGRVEDEVTALAPEIDALAAAEAALAAERADFERRAAAEPVAAPTGRAAESRGELAALRTGVEAARDERRRTLERVGTRERRRAELGAETDRLRAESAVGDNDGDLVGVLAAAAARLAAARAAAAEADERRLAADGERRAWAARAEALDQALEAARSRAGAQRLADIDEVVGTLLDLVDVDQGYEAAFEAAAGEALAAVVVTSVEAGRHALEILHDANTPGAVLALGAVSPPPPRVLGAGEGLRGHVRAATPHAGVEALLDALVGPVIVVGAGWPAAVDVALAHPGSLIVTRDGDRFGADGWRVRGEASGATGAAAEEARRRAESAASGAGTAEAVLRQARAESEAARRAEADAGRALDDHRRNARNRAEALGRAERDLRDATVDVETARTDLDELDRRAAQGDARLSELAATLPALEAEEAAAVERGRLMASARHRIEERAAAVASLRTDVEVRAAALDERRRYLRRRSGEVEARLARDVAERDAAESRRVELSAQVTAVGRLAATVSQRTTALDGALSELHERRRRQSEEARAVAATLDGLRVQRANEERRLEELRERARRAELDEAESGMRLDAAVEALRRDLDCEPGTAVAAPRPEVPAGENPTDRARQLERELRLMGPVNPLALEEFEALQERHGFLEGQLEDVRSSRRELAKVIRAVDEEIVAVFAAAYADVSVNFESLFETLFPGGQGRLVLTDPDDLLGSGLDIEAKPSGKNVRKLSLLSGGERSLTALAFLFAVFRSRPSPFYVMDEVEAALDDVNLHRFLDLLREFRQEAQLIIVSHQKRTMEAADCLYGVTMQPGGSSRVVSERVSTGRR